MKLRRFTSWHQIFLSSLVLLVLLASTHIVLAQVGGQSGAAMGRASGTDYMAGGLNRAGTQASGPIPGQSNSEMHWESDLLSNLMRDSNAETALSKLAVQHSSSEPVKHLAHEIVSDNMMISRSLYGGSLGKICPVISRTPARVQREMRKMEALSGVPFDGNYLSELVAYVQHDQIMIQDAKSSTESEDARTMILRMGILADHRLKQITKAADAENIVLR